MSGRMRSWRVRSSLVRSSRVRAGLERAAGVGLLGALAFGVVHIVGGTWHDNPRAVEFGIGLATVSGLLLAGLVVLVSRRPAPR